MNLSRPSRAALAAALLLGSCRSPDPKALLEVTDVEAYWAVDSASGTTEYIAPAVRFQVRNASAEALRAVQATAVFRRKGEEGVTWGSDFRQVSARGDALDPGEAIILVLKSDARYYSTGPPETMFTHEQFKDATAEFFLRVGSSGWTAFGRTDVERRIGSRTVTDAIPPPAP